MGEEILAIEPLSLLPVQGQWRKVEASKRIFSFRAEDRLLAGLRFEKSSGSSATADTAAQRFTFKRTGFFRPSMTVRVAGASTDLAVFQPGWDGGGLLTFSDGRRFEWRRTSAWRFEFNWLDTEARELLLLKPLPASRIEANVTVTADGSTSSDLGLLLTFGFYLSVLAVDELVAVSAAMGG